MASSPVQTIAITNFTGALTRQVNGDLNSGLAKFATSWGYDPFSQPGNLTWNYQTTSIVGTTASIGGASLPFGLPLAGVKTSKPYYYVVDNFGYYRVLQNTRVSYFIGSGNVVFNPVADGVVSTIGTVPGSFNFGAGMANFGGGVVISSDQNIVWFNNSSSGVSVDSQASVFGNASSVLAAPHPLKEFQGKLYYGNGNNIGEIINTGTFGFITTGSKLSPALPSGLTVVDLDVTPEGDYLLITGSFESPPYLGNGGGTHFTTTADFQNYAADSYVFQWNGSDTGVTAVRALPNFPATALSTFLDNQYTTIQDAFGMALLQGNQKLLTLPNNNSPFYNSLSPNGTFLTWVSVEGFAGTLTATSNGYSSVFSSLYYFGKLDEQNPTGLWRMNRIAPIGNGYTTQYTALNAVVTNYSSYSNEVWGFGRHLIGTQDALAQNFSSVFGRLHVFLLNPAQNTTPTQGVYETQTQLFSRRISVSQVRVYCDPTVSGNGFRLELLGSQYSNFGTASPVSNGVFTYTFGDVVDPQSGSSSVERINFNPDSKTQYSLGIRITNTGTTNMVIRKIELDFSEEGK